MSNITKGEQAFFKNTSVAATFICIFPLPQLRKELFFSEQLKEDIIFIMVGADIILALLSDFQGSVLKT